MIALILVNKAGVLLLDPTHVRWTQTELLNYVNDGQREIVIYRPDASSKVQIFPLDDSNTMQRLPTEAIRLLDVTRNLGLTGYTPGSPVMEIDRRILDTQIPDWHSSPPQQAIQHFSYNPKTPDIFYVYPRPANSLKVEIIVSVPPTELSSTSSPLSISDIYANALLDYMLYRAFSKDSEYADPAKAAGYYKTFMQSLGVKTTVDAAMTPHQDSVRQ
jgi:hypothetical protein